MVNNALDVFYDILDHSIEVLTDEEKTSGNKTILADATLETAVEELKIFKEHSLVDIRHYEVLKSDIKDRLKGEITQDEKNKLLFVRCRRFNRLYWTKKSQQKNLKQI